MITIPAHSEAPENAPEPGLYRHYKGHHYQVLGMGQHSESEEWLVIYQALYGSRGIWLRPLSLWLQPVNPDGDDDSDKKPDRPVAATERFVLIERAEIDPDAQKQAN